MTVSKQLFIAAQNADWMQVVLNRGPPCFHFEADRERFCLRNQEWHDHKSTPHPYKPLATLLAEVGGGVEMFLDKAIYEGLGLQDPSLRRK